MKKTNVHIELSNVTFDFNENVTLLGSCFSENISSKLSESGFNIYSNPFGVIFNPISISKHIVSAINKADYSDTIIEKSGVYTSWEVNSKVFAYDKKQMIEILNERNNKLHEFLKTSKVLFVTFGSAWVYELNETNKIVANCHKFSKSNFSKRLLAFEETVNSWEYSLDLLKSINPDIKIVFTVSPVRHVRDGLIDNSRSKATLINVIHDLCCKRNDTFYFPAYELVLDELRDYAYFGADGVHPNSFAIDHVWSKFQFCFLKKETINILNEYINLKKAVNHHPIHEKSIENQQFKKKLKSDILAFNKKYAQYNFKF